MLKDKYKMGRWSTTKQKGGGVYAGRRIEQFPNFGFSITMQEYVEKLKKVDASKTRKKQPEGKLSDDAVSYTHLTLPTIYSV